jgi:hypothetical protein
MFNSQILAFGHRGNRLPLDHPLRDVASSKGPTLVFGPETP